MATFTIVDGKLGGKPFPRRLSADKALDLSIEAWTLRVKWHSKAKRGDMLDDWGECALCDKYVYCTGCPLNEKCSHYCSTVFLTYCGARDAGNNSKAAKLATKMLKALKSLKKAK